jgi:hypothetical protein
VIDSDFPTARWGLSNDVNKNDVSKEIDSFGMHARKMLRPHGVCAESVLKGTDL